MNAKFCFVAAILAGFGAGVVVAAEAQKPLLVYELTFDGQTFEITDSGPADVTIHGKSVQDVAESLAKIPLDSITAK